MIGPSPLLLTASRDELAGGDLQHDWLTRQRTATCLLEAHHADKAADEFALALADAEVLLDRAVGMQAQLLAPIRVMASALGLARAKHDADDLILDAAGSLMVLADDPARDPFLRVACLREAWQGLCVALNDRLLVEGEAVEAVCRHVADACRRLAPVLKWLTSPDGPDVVTSVQ